MHNQWPAHKIKKVEKWKKAATTNDSWQHDIIKNMSEGKERQQTLKVK